MPSASIVTIGNELLNGHTADTNAAFICQKLLSIGIPVVSVYTVGDDISLIVRALKRAARDADIVIATGGLGPTDDDLTRQAFAKLMGVKLILDESILAKIKSYFEKRNIRMPEKNAIQAHIPKGAQAIDNTVGTAPGIYENIKKKQFFAMPGVPFEMERMLVDFVFPKLQKRKGGKFTIIKKVRCFGEGESAIAEKLGDLMNRHRNPLINCTVGGGAITLHIVASAKTKILAEKMAQKDNAIITSLLGDLIFGFDEQTLPEVVGRQLAKQKKTIATAESCTGGLVAKLITDTPGASDYFTQGWVTYSNKSKTQLLQIPPQLIEKYGAVSEQVAASMAKNARKKANSNFAVAITGIAGPAGGTEQKPVGLVFISICSDKNCLTKQFYFSQTRDIIRHRAAFTAMNMLRLMLKD